MSVLTKDQTIADVDKILTKHYTFGREGKKVEFIVWHHNAGVMTIEQIYNLFQTREASAHYQIQVDGKIGQLVNDWDTAWHAGDWNANVRSIGIEHSNSEVGGDWPISKLTLRVGAMLTASLCHTLGLGEPAWMVNVFPHNYFQATACPGKYFMGVINSQIQLAKEYYRDMKGETISSEKTHVVQPGENLSVIGEKYGLTWQALYSANRSLIGENPNLILPGMELVIPDQKVEIHIEQAGENLSVIGERYGVSWHAIAKANSLENPDLIYPGQELRIPR